MAMACRAGATLVDMEMYQFHPTGLLAGASRMTGMVLEEGLRGAGGILTNALGERYMERYDPLRKERSTRDVVSRSSYMEIVAGRGTPQGGVYIDVSHLGAEAVQQMFPGMVERCSDFGYDLRRQPVEVSPTAHFHMGGVKIDAECHTDLPGLLAAGEDSGGTHGSNRLGGNGVAESTVFGAIAGEVAARESVGGTPAELDLAQVAEIELRALQPLDDGSSGEDPFAIRSTLEALMWDSVGLVRDGAGLAGALDEIRLLRERAARLQVPSSRRLNLAWTESLDVQNLLQVAEAVTRSAMVRNESRGAHYRADFPEQDDERWLRNVYMRYEGAVEPRIWTESVVFSRMSAPAPVGV
jgi:succinate dehydrogenase / fumarate reductase flavoprotein subunit/fumarate reductase flavoprotein subunit